MKTFICFPKQFFLQNDFIDTMNAVLTGRPNFSCSITGNDLKQSPQKMQKLFKKNFLQKVTKETLKAAWKPRELFSDSQPKDFYSKFKKITICRLCKRRAPESLHWNWESSFDNSATFFARIGQKNRSVSKMEKKRNKTVLR